MEDGGNCRTRKGVLLQLTGRTFSSDCLYSSLLPWGSLDIQIAGRGSQLRFSSRFKAEKRQWHGNMTPNLGVFFFFVVVVLFFFLKKKKLFSSKNLVIRKAYLVNRFAMFPPKPRYVSLARGEIMDNGNYIFIQL